VDEPVEIDVHGLRRRLVRPLMEDDDVGEVLAPPGRRRAGGGAGTVIERSPSSFGAERLGGQPVEQVGERAVRGAAHEREPLPRPRRQVDEQSFDLRAQSQRDVDLVGPVEADVAEEQPAQADRMIRCPPPLLRRKVSLAKRARSAADPCVAVDT
jgi:hypothetical protein